MFTPFFLIESFVASSSSAFQSTLFPPGLEKKIEYLGDGPAVTTPIDFCHSKLAPKLIS